MSSAHRKRKWCSESALVRSRCLYRGAAHGHVDHSAEFHRAAAECSLTTLPQVFSSLFTFYCFSHKLRVTWKYFHSFYSWSNLTINFYCSSGLQCLHTDLEPEGEAVKVQFQLCALPWHCTGPAAPGRSHKLTEYDFAIPKTSKWDLFI